MKRLLCFLSVLSAATLGWGYTYIYTNNDPTLLPVKWPPGQVPLQIMLGTATTLSDGSTFSASAQTAANAWNAVLGNLQLQSQIVAPGTPNNRNGINELAFGTNVFGSAFGSGVLAVTTTRVSATNGDRIEADTIFNNKDWQWDSYRGTLHSGTVDIQRVAIHELGHTLGLDHPDQAGQSVTAIMNSTVSSVDRLTTDDITGVQNLYGPAPLGSIPANDNFANAAVLGTTTAAVTVKGYTTNATKESGEPNHAANAGGHSIWWKWTPQANGSVTIDTKGSYSDTTLALYTGTALSALTEIASNDDLQLPTSTDPTHIQASKVTFNATAGTTYLIAVDGFDGDSSAVTLNLAFAATATAPVITTQPSSQIVTAGQSASFSVIAAGTSPLSYQWYLGTTAITGATGTTLSLSNVLTTDAGTYFVTVSNSLGSVNSNSVTLTVNAAPAPTPTPTPAPSGGGGGGGGGGVSDWFVALLSVLGIGRRIFRSRS